MLRQLNARSGLVSKVLLAAWVVFVVSLVLLSARRARAQDTLSDVVRWQATKDAPEPPNAPAPANAASGVPLGTTLACRSAGATLGYDVYVGTVNPPPSVTHVATCSYAPTLAPSTKYYWKVVAKNQKGTMAGQVWSFTTAAAVALPPTITCPANQNATTSTASAAVTYPPPVASEGASAVCSPPSGGQFPVGATPVHCVAAKNAQSAQCGFEVTVALLPTTPTPGGSTAPLVHQANVQIAGSFRLSESLGTADGCGFSFAGGPIAASGRGTLYMANRCHNVGEFPIPASVGVSPTIPGLPLVSTMTQPFADATEGHLGPFGGPVPEALYGLLVLPDGRLRMTGNIYYDAAYNLAAGQAIRSGTLSTPSFSGWFPMGNMGPYNQDFASGQLAAVPADWQAALGGNALATFFGFPIVTRQSMGPSAFVFDGTSTAPTAATLLVYPNAHSTLGNWLGTVANPVYNMGTQEGTPVIVPGWRSLLYFGVTGLGTPCYGEGTGDPALAGTPEPDAPSQNYCYDPQNSSKGSHAYPYAAYVWAYDLNDLAAVKAGTRQPWDVVPYESWVLQLPYPLGAFSSVAATFDQTTKTIYLGQMVTDQGGGYFAGPVFHAIKVQ